MPDIQWDWKIIQEITSGGVGIVAIFFGYKVVMVFIDLWRTSTDAINRNTESFNKLSEVVDRATARDIEFQKATMEILHDIKETSLETNRYARRMHDRLVVHDYDRDKEKVAHK